MHLTVKSSGPYFVESEPLANEFNRFLSALSIRGLSAMTLRAYAYDLLTMHRWLLSTKYDVYALTQTNLLDFIAYKKALNATPKSINRELITIRQFFRFLTGVDLAPAVGSTVSAGHYKGRGMDKNLGLHRLKSKRQLNLRVKTPRTLVEPLTEEQVCAFLGTLRRRVFLVTGTGRTFNAAKSKALARIERVRRQHQCGSEHSRLSEVTGHHYQWSWWVLGSSWAPLWRLELWMELWMDLLFRSLMRLPEDQRSLRFRNLSLKSPHNSQVKMCHVSLAI
jgi:Phage integrase, N-terminal SAM-like domain